MKKRILLGIIIVFAVILIFYGAICTKRQIDIKKDSKVLVVYYSAQGYTDNVAKQIAKNF